MSKRTLTREQVVFEWLQMSISDFFFAFKIEGSFVRYAPFFNAMGFELMCKAYLLGCRASDYEGLLVQAGLEKVDRIAKKKELSHKLSEIIGDIKNRKPRGQIPYLLSQNFDGFSGSDFVNTLESAYLECRYPVPRQIYKSFPIHGMKRMYSDPIYSSGLHKFCYSVAREILTYINDDFSIKVSRSFLETLRPKATCKRFRRLFFADRANALIGKREVAS